MNARSFTPETQAISSLLAERGFRVSRGTYQHGNGDTLPTIVVDRPDTPEWNGVWLPYETKPEFDGDIFGEAQATLDVAFMAIKKWNEDAYLFVKE